MTLTKIKCTICRDVRMDWSYQEHYEAYHKLLFKIHEKIESLRKYEYEHELSPFNEVVSQKRLLESLLEDNKK